MMKTGKPHLLYNGRCLNCGESYCPNMDYFDCKGGVGQWNWPKGATTGRDTSTTTGTSGTAQSGSQKDMKTASPSGVATTSQKTTPESQQSDGGFNKKAYEDFMKRL